MRRRNRLNATLGTFVEMCEQLVVNDIIFDDFGCVISHEFNYLYKPSSSQPPLNSCLVCSCIEAFLHAFLTAASNWRYMFLEKATFSLLALYQNVNHRAKKTRSTAVFYNKANANDSVTDFNELRTTIRHLFQK